MEQEGECQSQGEVGWREIGSVTFRLERSPRSQECNQFPDEHRNISGHFNLPLTRFKSKSLIIDWENLIQRTNAFFLKAFLLVAEKEGLNASGSLTGERKGRGSKCGDHVKRNREREGN